MRSLSEPCLKPFWFDSLFWAAMLAAPVCWILLWLIGVPLSPEPPNSRQLIGSVLVMPLLEEIVFRGGLQTYLLERQSFRHRYAGISRANLITSVCFAALHLVSQPLLSAALVFVPSLVFGCARERYGRIHASVVLHSFYNLGFVVLFASISSD